MDEAWREGLFHGMELVNGEDFYPAAYPWIEEKKLAILATSDYHLPTPPRGPGPRGRSRSSSRASADAEGVREALVRPAHRRLARRRRLGRRGALARPVEGRGRGSLAVPAARPGESALLRLRNASAIPFRLRVRGAPAWARVEPGTAGAQATSLLRFVRVARRRAGPLLGTLELEVENLHVGPGRNLVVTLPVRPTVREP